MDSKYIAVITGDIVNSKGQPPAPWLANLKEVLSAYGSTPSKWDIFRGDMFQLQCEPDKALLAAIQIKASIRRIKKLDVRIAIGVGQQGYDSKNITEANGEAFILSGQQFDRLKKRRLMVNTPWKKFDASWNLYIQLAALTMDEWPAKTAEVLFAKLCQEELNQKELASLLERGQSTISAALARSGYEEIKWMIDKYSQDINDQINLS